MRILIIAALAVLTTGLSTASQSAELREAILKKAKEIYGAAAPSTVTFAPPPDFGFKPKSWPVIDLGTAKGGQKTHQTVGGTTDPSDVVEQGIEMERRGNQVYVDASPCDLRIVVFTDPFKADDSKKPVKCGDKVIQTKRYVQY